MNEADRNDSRRPTRRAALLGAAAAVTMAPTVPMAAAPAIDAGAVPAKIDTNHPDAELIAACAEHDRAWKEVEDLHDDPKRTADNKALGNACQPAFAREHAAIQRMLELRATTPDGIQARAHSLALANSHFNWSWDPEGTHGQMLVALLRDAAAIGGTRAIMPPSPDAELLVFCADYMATFRAAEDHPATRFVDIPPHVLADQGKLFDRMLNLAEDIAGTRAFTPEGRRAKAEVARASIDHAEGYGPELTAWDGGGGKRQLAWSLIHDLLGKDPAWKNARAEEAAA